MKSTQAMRDRIRELMGREQDDYDRAVECVLDDLESLIPAPAQSMWMPIETAPRDEDLLLGWWREWPERRWEMAAGLAGSTRGGWLHGQATHWQRLPGPPDAAQPPAAPVAPRKPVCCYCDNDLCCAHCGREQPDDSEQPPAAPAETLAVNGPGVAERIGQDHQRSSAETSGQEG